MSTHRNRDSLPPVPGPKKKRRPAQPQPSSQSFTPLQFALCCAGLVGTGLLLVGIVMFSAQFSKPIAPTAAPVDDLAASPVAVLNNQALQSALLAILQADHQGETQRPDKLVLEAPDPKSRFKIPFRYNAIDTKYEIENRGSVISKKGLTGFVYVTPPGEPCYIDYERVTAVLRPDAFQGGIFTNAVIDPWTGQRDEVRFDQLPMEDEKIPGVVTFAPAKPNSDRQRGSYYHVSRVRRLIGDHPPLDPAFPATLDGLTAKLDSPGFYEKMLALTGLGKLGDAGAPAAEKVAALLLNSYFRQYALRTLADTHAPPELALKTYLPLLKPDLVSSKERQVALDGVAALGPGAIPAIPELLQLLRANVDRDQVLAVFRAMGEPAVAPLLNSARAEQFPNPQDPVAVQAWASRKFNALPGEIDLQVFVALGAIGEPAVEPVIQYLDQLLTSTATLPDQLRRRQLIEALAALGRSAPASVAPMVALLRKHGVGWINVNNFRSNLIHVYAQEVGRNGAGILAADLKSPNLGDRQSAAESLVQLGPDAAPALDALIEYVRDQRADFGWQFAVEALLAIGPEAARAVPELSAALSDESFPVRLRAAQALRKLGPAAAPAAARLGNALADREFQVVQPAAEALAIIGIQDVTAREALREGLSKAKPHCVQFVLEALQTLGPAAQSAAPDIVAVYKASKDTDVRNAARAALTKIDVGALKQLE